MTRAKTILFFPLNSPGHINSLISLADTLRDVYNYRVIFMLLGPPMSNIIQDHDHELIIIDERQPYEDFEIIDFEDPERNETLAIQQGLQKKQYTGASKWPRLLVKMQNIFKLPPIEAHIESFPEFDLRMVAEIVDHHSKYEQVINELEPDLIVVDAYFIPPCVLKYKAPWVKIWSANPLTLTKPKLPNGFKPPPMIGLKFLDKQTRQQLERDQPDKLAALKQEWQLANQRLTEAFAKRGLSEPIKNFYESHGCVAPSGKDSDDSPNLNIYTYPKHLDYDQDDDIFEYPPRCFRVDSLVRGSPKKHSDQLKCWAEKLHEGMKGKKGAIFFSLGSIASGNVTLVLRILDILKQDTEHLYIVSKGIFGSKYSLPDNMIGDNYLPQTFFLEHVDLAIVHGGNNTITECSYYGVPMIVLPLFGDQTDNAQRVEDLKLGRRLNAHDCNSQQLLGAINDILNDKELTQKCKMLGKQMRQRDEAPKVAFMLNKLVNEGNLSNEFIDSCRDKNFAEIQQNPNPNQPN